MWDGMKSVLWSRRGHRSLPRFVTPLPYSVNNSARRDGRWQVVGALQVDEGRSTSSTFLTRLSSLTSLPRLAGQGWISSGSPNLGVPAS